MVARGGADDLNVSDGSVVDGLLELHERGIETALEAAEENETLGLGKSVDLLEERRVSKRLG